MAKKRPVKCKEVYDFELFDISDITEDIKFKSRREISLVLKAQSSDFNLMKYYLAVKDHADRIGVQLGMMTEEADEGNPQ